LVSLPNAGLLVGVNAQRFGSFECGCFSPKCLDGTDYCLPAFARSIKVDYLFALGDRLGDCSLTEVHSKAVTNGRRTISLPARCKHLLKKISLLDLDRSVK